MKDKSAEKGREYIGGKIYIICITLIVIVFIIAIAYHTTTSFDINLNMDNNTLEIFKLAYNSSGI